MLLEGVHQELFLGREITLISIVKPGPFQRIPSSEKAEINVGPGQKTWESLLKKQIKYLQEILLGMLEVACLCPGRNREPVIALLVLNPSGCSGLAQ